MPRVDALPTSMAAVGPPAAESVGPAVTTGLTLAYVALVVGFGTLWLAVNVYQYYPLVRALVETLVGGRSPAGQTRYLRHATDGGLPRIDVLLPAYDEAAVIEDAVRSVLEAEYAADRLDLHVLVEPDDADTRRELERLAADLEFEVHVVPEAYPGTPSKPRALNYGYTVTDAGIVGVVDAEDVVDGGLFREVAAALDTGAADYALGHLDMANEDDGWLNLLFRAEYGFWYDLVVPAFVRADYPVPLGGTTCFFRRPVLESVAYVRSRREGLPWSISEQLWLAEHDLHVPVPWDPDHMTEDFELGMLLWEEGHAFAYLPSTTREESPVDLDGWLDQRVRWQTGKLQTFGKYLREPPSSWRQRLHLGWQSALPHLGPINVLGLGLVFWLALLVGVEPPAPLGWLLGLGLLFFVVSAGVFAAGYWVVSDVPRPERLRRASIVAVTVPAYWLLQWAADVRALLDLHRDRATWTPSRHLGRHGAGGRVAAAAYIDRPRLPTELSTRQVAVALAGVVAVGAALRLYDLDRWSLWHDEVYTVAVRGSAPVGDLLTMTTDPHPPLYYLLVKGWMAVAGSTPVAVRGLSALLGIGALLAVFWLGRTVADDGTGLVAALLVATSATHLHVARTARMYALFSLLAVLSWTLYVRLRTDGRCFSWIPRRDGAYALAYVVVTAALLYTHVYGVFVVGSQHLARWFSRAGRVDRRLWWAMQATLAVLFAPWALVLGRQVLAFSEPASGSPIAWIVPPTVGLFREAVLLLGGYPAMYPIEAGGPPALLATGTVLFVATVALVFATVTYEPADGWRYFLVVDRRTALLAVFVVAMFVPFVLSYLAFPIFVPRYALVAGLPLFVLVARGLTNVPELRWRAALLAVLLVGSLATTGLYFDADTSEDWRGAAAYLEAGATEGDLVVVQPTWLREDLDVYAPALPADRYALRPDDRLDPADLERLEALAADRGTVWLVRHEGTESDLAMAVLEDSHERAGAFDGGVVTVVRFERRR